MVVSFAAVLARNVLGYVPPVVPQAWWEQADNATELFAVAAGGVRVARTSGPARAAWLAFTLGLFAFFAGDVYWTAMRENLASPPRFGRTWLLIAAGFAVFAVADTIYLCQAALGTYREFGVLDGGWPAVYVLVAFAAWQPARRIDARAVLRGWAMLLLPARRPWPAPPPP